MLPHESTSHAVGRPAPQRATAPLRARAGAVLALALAAALLGTPAPAAQAADAPDRDDITFTPFTTNSHFAAGKHRGTTERWGKVFLDDPPARRTVAGDRYRVARWISPWVTPGHDFDELVASWDVSTPGRSWVQVDVQVRTASGRWASWDMVGRWAATDRRMPRTTRTPQADDRARMAVDTLRTNGAGVFDRWRVRATLYTPVHQDAEPYIDTLGAVASHVPDVDGVRTSRPSLDRRVALDVPRYSQMIHRGDYPQYGNGGEAWCSPTSTAMVLGYYGTQPHPKWYRWVERDHPDRVVDHAARSTYDHDYQGTGNWPFNTAWAALTTRTAYVTRLRSMREAERFLANGIPLVASIDFDRGELSGAPISASNGHLLVISGVTADGDVIVNDPAGRDNSEVRRVYDRGQFEDAWLSGSGGLTYVVRHGGHRIPARRGATNW